MNTAERGDGASLIGMVGAHQETGAVYSFSASTWIKISILAGLFAVVHWWQFQVLLGTWLHNPNWSHGLIIPLFSLYLLYSRRHELFSVERRVCLWGLPVIILGIVFQIIAYYPIGTYWLCQLAMIPILLGLVLYLGGPGMVRVTWLPIVFLVFAMPIPNMLYSRIAFPLQNMAAKASGVILQILGIQIDVTASHLTITSLSGKIHPLTVAEACSGVRSLMAFVALGVAMAYLAQRPLWQRVIMVAAAVPIAIACNVIRVTITCAMFVVDHPELGQKFMHEFMGLVMLGPALLMLWLLGWLLQSLFIEVDEERPGDQESPEGVEA